MYSTVFRSVSWFSLLDIFTNKIEPGTKDSAVRNLTITIYSTPMPEESEDCLYLNVWVPSGDAPEGGFPVMFWLYGGNLQFGTAGLPMYSGEHIAADRGVIVVGTNYRTNGKTLSANT